MKKSIQLLAVLILLLVNNIYPISTASAEGDIQSDNLETSREKVNNLVNQAEIVKENSFEVDDETKRNLVLELNKELEKSKKYNVNVVKENNPSDYVILGMKLPNGMTQYSLSVSSISTNKEEITNDVEFLNFTFNDKLVLDNVYEMKGILDENNTVHSKVWINGELYNSVDTNISKLIEDKKAEIAGDQIAEEQMNQIEEKQLKEMPEFSASGLAKRWSCTQKCVSSKGVSLMVIGVMGGVCIAVCNPAALAASAGLAGGACYACVNSTGVLGVTTVFKCWEKCPY